jgi:hypothetical protein
MIDNSYYIILNRLKAFANGHYLINTFTYHEIANFDISKNPEYPIMHAVPVSMNPVKGAINYSFDITFASWVRAKEDKQENEVTVISDMHRCALDLVTEITNGNILFGSDVSIDGDAVILPFIDEFANVLSGVTLQMTIQIPYDWSACDIPANWVEGTGDIPDFGGRSLTLDVLDEGTFVVAAREMDFRGSAVTVTYEGNKAIVTITGGGGGGAVDSVNGQTGVVVLDSADVGADASGSAAAALTSANSYTDAEIAALTIVESVTGNVVDNTDPANPIVTQVQPDWNASSGLGQILNKPDLEDLPYIPLAGTVSGSPVTGTIEIIDAGDEVPREVLVQQNSGTGGYIKLIFDYSSVALVINDGTNSTAQVLGNEAITIIGDKPTFQGQIYNADYSANFVLRSLIDQEVMKSRIWTKAGTPTTTDDSTEGYIVGSLIWDTTNSILYRCSSNTATAATWVNVWSELPISTATQAALDELNSYTEIIRAGASIPAGTTRYLVPGLSGFGTSLVVNMAERAIHTSFRIMTGSAQPANGNMTITRQFTTPTGTVLQSDVLTIPASSPIGVYEFTGSDFDARLIDCNVKFTFVNNGTSSSASVQGLERTFTK